MLTFLKRVHITKGKFAFDIFEKITIRERNEFLHSDSNKNIISNE